MSLEGRNLQSTNIKESVLVFRQSSYHFTLVADNKNTTHNWTTNSSPKSKNSVNVVHISFMCPCSDAHKNKQHLLSLLQSECRFKLQKKKQKMAEGHVDTLSPHHPTHTHIHILTHSCPIHFFKVTPLSLAPKCIMNMWPVA